MTIHNVYISDLDDPKFNWDGGDWNGNVPRPLSPSFPPAGATFNLFCHVMNAIQRGELPGKQTDFGGWVARVRKPRLVRLLHDWYGPEGAAADPRWRPFAEHLQALRAFLDTLDTEKEYALVAWEL